MRWFRSGSRATVSPAAAKFLQPRVRLSLDPLARRGLGSPTDANQETSAPHRRGPRPHLRRMHARPPRRPGGAQGLGRARALERRRRRRGGVPLGERLDAGSRAGGRAQAGGLQQVYNDAYSATSRRRSTPTPAPSPARTRTRTWTPTTRSPSWPGTPASRHRATPAYPRTWWPARGVKLRLRSTLSGNKEAWIYLFKRSGDISPGAGKQFVNYTFNLLSGNYKTTYKLAGRAQPRELDHHHAVLHGPLLRPLAQRPAEGHHGRDATGVDILDRAKAQFAPGNCGRSENTFNDAEGAFIANKSGPVRAIRSYIGANSGPVTQREHVFYERREDVRTFLRVHAMPGPSWTTSTTRAAASGMTYKNNDNTGGVTIDGMPDSRDGRARSPGRAWTAPRAASRSSTRPTPTSPGFASSSYYFDDSTPARPGAETQCTGDNTASAAAGPGSRSHHPEHRSAHRPRSTTCSPPAPSTSRTPARPTGGPQRSGWPRRSSVSADAASRSRPPRRWRRPAPGHPERPLDHPGAHARARQDHGHELAPVGPEAVHRARCPESEHESRRAAARRGGFSASSTISWVPGACLRNSSSKAILKA